MKNSASPPTTSLVVQNQVSLAPFNSWSVGGPAEFYVSPRSVEELQEALGWARAHSVNTTFLSGGTNVLISDEGVPGLVIHLHKLAGVESEERDDRLQITASAGTAKSELLKAFLKAKLEPAIFLAGLPGDVGAGVVMNAGIGEQMKPREFVEITDWIEVLKQDAEGKFSIVRFARENLQWSYRHCDGWQPGVIIRVGLSWPLTPNPTVMERTKQMNQARLKKQPLEWPSCGSVFRNPPALLGTGAIKQTAGQLIDQCGLRGFRIGGAEVSEKHANFIINREKATARDLHAVIQHVQNVVQQKFGISLKTEVVYLGRW